MSTRAASAAALLNLRRVAVEEGWEDSEEDPEGVSDGHSSSDSPQSRASSTAGARAAGAAPAAEDTVDLTDDAEEQVYTVERIIKRRISRWAGSRYDYLMVWSPTVEGGEREETWEPEQNVLDCGALIEEYEEQLRQLDPGEQVGANDGYFTWLEKGKDADYESPSKAPRLDWGRGGARGMAEFRDDLLELKRYPDDYHDESLAGLPTSQDPDGEDYTPPPLREPHNAPYREYDLVGGRAASDVDGDELAFETSSVSQEEHEDSVRC